MRIPKSEKVPKGPKKLTFYAGLDLSFSGTGLCITNKKFNRVTTSLITSNPEDSVLVRMLHLADDIVKNLDPLFTLESKVSSVFIERLAFGARSNRQLQIAGLHYFVRMQIQRRFPSVKIYTIPATTVKKWVAGNGRAKKNLMMKAAFKNWGFDTDDDNICDAYCLARYGVEKKLWKAKPELEKVM